MKLVIIEGTDNSGKDTLINKLLERIPSVTLIHCSKPTSKKFASKEQDALFEIYARAIVEHRYDYTHMIIMNRSHIGEFVYGGLYRDRDYEEVEEMILNVDDLLLSRKDLEIKYVQLICDSNILLNKNEDGKSLSEGDLEKIKKEIDAFTYIFGASKLPKKLIYVNKGDEFRSRENIFEEVWKFINE